MNAPGLNPQVNPLEFPDIVQGQDSDTPAAAQTTSPMKTHGVAAKALKIQRDPDSPFEPVVRQLFN